jgi:hypothetical protein
MTASRDIPNTVHGGATRVVRDFGAPGLLAGMVAVFFAKILLGNAWLWEDMLYYSYPVRSFAASSLAMGQLPLWNPYTFGGMPLLADIQTTVLYLPCMALALFVRDGVLNFYWLEVMVVAHYVLAGWSMFLLARSFGLHRAPALFAGAAYMLSGFMITHAIHQQIITMVAWYPLIILLFRGGLAGRSWRPVFLGAIVLGHSTFAGYPQLSLYFHFFLFAWYLFMLLDAHRGRALFSRPAVLMSAKAVVFVVLGLAIAAIQLLPTAELADLSQRAAITYEKSAEGSLIPSQFLTLFSPKFFGAAGAGGFNYWGPGTYWYYWETCIYLGVLPLMLLALSPVLARRNTHVLFLWGVVLFTVLFSLGGNFPLHRLFYEHVPGFSKFRNPARMGIFLSFAASLLSAFSLDALLHGERKRLNLRGARIALLLVSGIGAALWIVTAGGVLDGTFVFMKNAAISAHVRSSAHLALGVLLVSGGALYTLLLRPKPVSQAGYILLVLFGADMYLFGADQNTATVNPGEYFRRAEPVVRFLREDGRNELFRVNTRNQFGMIMDRNQGMVDRIATTEGYTPLVLQRALPSFAGDLVFFDIMNVKYKTLADQAQGRMTLALHPSYMPRASVLFDAKVTATEDALVAAMRDTTWNHRRTAILEKPPAIPLGPAPEGASATARIEEYENNRIVVNVQTPANGVLLLAEVAYPGWIASVDGRESEVLRADYSLRAVAVPAGTHRVVMTFAHPPFVLGGWISAGGLLICLAGIMLISVRPARTTGKEN